MVHWHTSFHGFLRQVKAVPGKVNDHGFALIAALILIAIVGIVSATVLQSTSTEVAISGYHKRAVEGLYAAEAGLAEVQARLRKNPGAEAQFIYDFQPGYSTQWSAYLVAVPNWEVQTDPTFSTQDTNYFPLPGNPTNTISQLNSLQSSLSYWVKLQHKTERVAEQAGHHTSRPHYVDKDGSLSRHRGASKGNILYFGYPTPAVLRPVQYTALGPNPYLPVERVTAYSVGKGQTTRIQGDVVHYPGPPQIAALFTKNEVVLAVEEERFNGHDACGASLSLPPIVAREIVLSAPTFQFDGAPPSPVVATFNMDLPAIVSEFQTGAIVISEDQRNRQWGSPSLAVTVLARYEVVPHPEGLVLEQVTGYGILAVDGHVRIQGTVSWSGLIIVTGKLIFDAPGNSFRMRGGLWAGGFEARAGLVDVQYDSCAIKSALLTPPVRLINWKELY